MRLKYFVPSPALQHCLSVHAAVTEVTEAQTVVLPAMLPNLHIRLAGHSTYALADGRCIPAPAISVIGPTSHAYRLRFSPGFRMVAVGLLPLGWQALLGISANVCTDQLLAGDDLWPASALARLLDALHACPLDGRHIGTVESLLEQGRWGVGKRSHESVQTAAIDEWLENSPALSLDALCGTLGVGARQLRRITERTHGLPPKLLAMKYRALRTAHALAVRHADTAARHTSHAMLLYADQSHAIRDFQRFIGLTPANLERNYSLARATLAGRQRAGVRRPLALLS